MYGPYPLPLSRAAHYAAAFTLTHDPSGTTYECARCGAQFGTNERAAVLHALKGAETFDTTRHTLEREAARIARLTDWSRA